MPQMADIVVKDWANVANITFVKKTAAAGDGSAAVWKVDSSSTIPAHKPELRCHSSGNSEKRKVRVTGRFPYTTANAQGVHEVRSYVQCSYEIDVPLNVPEVTHLQEWVAWFVNALNSGLLRDSFRTTYAPTA